MILLLPGDGNGPETIAATESLIRAASDAEIAVGQIGLSAYESTGEYLPHDTLDLIDNHPIIVSGPTVDHGDKTAVRNPLVSLMTHLDLFARSRTFRSYLDFGSDRTEVTVWGSNVNTGKDITETEEFDGITIRKFIRSAFYKRMMSAALSDMERSGKTKVACLSRDDFFPSASKLFRDAFGELFDTGNREVCYLNVKDWISDAVSDPTKYGYLIAVDLYASVVDSVMAGLTGGECLTPYEYVGDRNVLVLPAGVSVSEAPWSVSAAVSASIALREAGMVAESNAVMKALRATVETGDRPAELGGQMPAGEFVCSVISHLRPSAGGKIVISAADEHP